MVVEKDLILLGGENLLLLAASLLVLTGTLACVETMAASSVQEQMQQDVFMILCLRASRDEVDRQRVKAIKQELESSDLCRRVKQALSTRQRRPIVPLTFPIVAGAQLGDVQGGVGKLVEVLRAVLGLDKRSQVSQSRIPKSVIHTVCLSSSSFFGKPCSPSRC